MTNDNTILNRLSEKLDISPSDFSAAIDRHRALANWLKGGTYLDGSFPSVYLQGSFRLGTVVRPFRGGSETEYDLDQVLELTNRAAAPLPSRLKSDVGFRLRENRHYCRMMAREGSRCWRLDYQTGEGHLDFHIDVLPALRSASGQLAGVDITNRRSSTYGWSESNPNGYYRWFKARNPLSPELIESQRTRLIERWEADRDFIGDFPIQLVRSPLQRLIQLLKRHRDVYFDGHNGSPASIVITTLAAHLYQPGQDLSEMVSRFTDYVLERYTLAARDHTTPNDGHLSYSPSYGWRVTNPAHSAENFTDKWSSDTSLPLAFLDWTLRLRRDFEGVSQSGNELDFSIRASTENPRFEYPIQLLQESQEMTGPGSGDFTSTLLPLIHHAIDGLIEWGPIAGEARRGIAIAHEGESKDLARVNFFQTIRHQGQQFTPSQRATIAVMLQRYSAKPSFVFCCNTLLGTATPAMLANCIRDHFSGYQVLEWPICRLLPTEVRLPTSRR